MPTIMIILNVAFIAGVVAAIVGLCAWGIVSDRPYATYLTHRNTVPAPRRFAPRRRGAYERRRFSRVALTEEVLAGRRGYTRGGPFR